MIELTDQQLRTLDAQPQPPVVVDSRSGQEYLLIRRDVFEKMQATMRPLARAWDDPRLDDYEVYREKKT